MFFIIRLITGLCYPSYERLAEAAGCARSTVAEAIHMLERANVLTWSNRLVRVREAEPERDMFGRVTYRWRVLRTSNGYAFNDPKPVAKPTVSSKSDFKTETTNQVLFSEGAVEDSPLERALAALGKAARADSNTDELENG
jgi:hypothetical protein